MSDKHDFKTALVWWQIQLKKYPQEQAQDAAIQTALRIADRLSSGEVSEEMATEGIKVMSAEFPQHIEPTQAILIGQPKSIFKAMTQQLIKECGDAD